MCVCVFVCVCVSNSLPLFNICFFYLHIAYTKMASNLERAYNKHFAKEFPEEVIVSDEDYDIDEDDSFKARKRGKTCRANDRSSFKKTKLNCKLVFPFLIFPGNCKHAFIEQGIAGL